MKAMIFAAGLGTRLKPLTDRMPKALVPVGGKPMIDQVMEKLQAAGYDDIVVNVHHFAGQIIDHLHGRHGVQISDESDRLLETGGGVLHAAELLKGCGAFLIHNVDILSNADLKAFQQAYSERIVNEPETLAELLVTARPSSRKLLFEPHSLRLVGWKNLNTGKVGSPFKDFREENCIALAFSGIHIMNESILQRLQEYSESIDSPAFPIMDFYFSIATEYPIYAHIAPELQILDIGKIDRLPEAERMYRMLQEGAPKS